MWITLNLNPSLYKKIRGFKTYLLATIMGSGGALVVAFDSIDANVNWKGWLYEHTSYGGALIVGFSLLFALLRYQTSRAVLNAINPPEPPEDVPEPEVPEIPEVK